MVFCEIEKRGLPNECQTDEISNKAISITQNVLLLVINRFERLNWFVIRCVLSVFSGLKWFQDIEMESEKDPMDNTNDSTSIVTDSIPRLKRTNVAKLTGISENARTSNFRFVFKKKKHPCRCGRSYMIEFHLCWYISVSVLVIFSSNLPTYLIKCRWYYILRHVLYYPNIVLCNILAFNRNNFLYPVCLENKFK